MRLDTFHLVFCSNIFVNLLILNQLYVLFSGTEYGHCSFQQGVSKLTKKFTDYSSDQCQQSSETSHKIVTENQGKLYTQKKKKYKQTII